ncbi:unnamed protein product, partial [Prorocentrum cordatum]
PPAREEEPQPPQPSHGSVRGRGPGDGERRRQREGPAEHSLRGAVLQDQDLRLLAEEPVHPRPGLQVRARRPRDVIDARPQEHVSLPLDDNQGQLHGRRVSLRPQPRGAEGDGQVLQDHHVQLLIQRQVLAGGAVPPRARRERAAA